MTGVASSSGASTPSSTSSKGDDSFKILFRGPLLLEVEGSGTVMTEIISSEESQRQRGVKNKYVQKKRINQQTKKSLATTRSWDLLVCFCEQNVGFVS